MQRHGEWRGLDRFKVYLRVGGMISKLAGLMILNAPGVN